MEIDSIIARLGEMGACCDAEDDKTACTEAAGILFTLGEGGVKTSEEAADLVYDYNAMAKQYQAMHQKYEVPVRPKNLGGVWLCPDCNRQMRPGNNYCWNCGKRLGW